MVVQQPQVRTVVGNVASPVQQVGSPPAMTYSGPRVATAAPVIVQSASGVRAPPSPYFPQSVQTVVQQEPTGTLEKRLSATFEDPINASQKEKARGSSIRHEKKPSAKTRPEDPGCFSCCSKPAVKEVDAVLIGAGIMSSTVGLMLKMLEPSWKIVCFERLHAVAQESSNGFNNAGTGHAGFMEPNYTKEVFEQNGDKKAPKVLKTVTTEKVNHVCQQFNTSRLYWDSLRKRELLPDPDTFIHQTNHIALGIGKEQVDFIKKRYEAMKNHESGQFNSMEIAEDRKTQEQWAPLITAGRDPNEPMCMTKVPYGTDVDFGALSRAQMDSFMNLGGDLRLFTTVTDLKKDKDGTWLVTTKNTSTGRGIAVYKTPFVYVGAGGWALLMLQKAGIPQVRGYMALPVTGDWAVCQNPDVVARHKVKVYAPGAPGAPPMSMPHLDYRTIGGKEMLLFGPFGSITMKFLRYGSVLDAFKALKPHNICATVGALSRNMSLAVMLMKDVFKSGRGKLADIRHYYPEADPEDWTLIPAGVRAQIIKKDPKTGKGMLQFGTEVVTNDEATICGLLGASPGASTCVTIALDTIEKCFLNKPSLDKDRWVKTLQAMIPTWSPGIAAGDMKGMTPQAIEQLYLSTGATLGVNPK
jgi:malate dehydrogenase (quinone)